MYIDAGPMGNHTRFINHSCKENCEAKPLAVNQTKIVAVKKINKSEELSLDYGKDYFKNKTCLCDETNCLENEKKKWLCNGSNTNSFWKENEDKVRRNTNKETSNKNKII